MQNSTPTFPDEYHLILQQLSPDGTPLAITMASAADVQAERLKYYNFLKWCRRPANRNSVVHLAGRYNQVTISCQDNRMIFRLKTPQALVAASPLAQAFRAAVPDAPALPPSANPRLFNETPRGEAKPLVQEFEPIRAPVPSASFGDFMQAGMSAADKAAIDAEHARLLARSASIEEHGVEVEVPERAWFPAEQRTGKATKHGPEDKLQYVMDKLIFDCEPATLPYPPTKDDIHEVSGSTVTRRTREWNEFFADNGWFFYIDFTSNDIGWTFSLNEEGNALLNQHGLRPAARRAAYQIDDRNLIREKVSRIFSEPQ